MLQLNEVFPENEPMARHKFLSWFFGRQNGTLDIEKMPAYLALAAITEWLDTKGIYIDRDTERHCYRIWDYREGEPETDFPVEWDSGDTHEQSKIETVRQAVLIYCTNSQDLPKPSAISSNDDDLPF